MYTKKKNLIVGIFLLVCLVITFLFIKIKWKSNDLSDPDKMVQHVEEALGDDLKKQHAI